MVDVKRGSMIACCVMMFMHSVRAADTVQLRIVSEQGAQISSIAAGYPCMIELLVSTTDSLQKKPTITGLAPEEIIREQETTQVYVINGATTRQRTITYVVSFADMGTKTIGPAQVFTPTGVLTSNTATIDVVDPATVQPKSKKFVVARLVLQKESAYVNEAVPYTIQFYCTDDAVNQVNVQPWSLPTATNYPLDTIQRTTATMHGVECNLLTWSGVVYPHTAGRVQFPSIVFEYTEPALSSHLQHQWAQFMQMFSPVSVHKQIRTNGASLQVQPLPAAKHPVTGVGTLSDVQLHCSADTVQQGESLVCTLTFEGTFDPQAVNVPPLQVPDTLRVYESKVSTSGSYPRVTKHYEYIVQALTDGAIEIPAQSYYFFDPREAMYRRIVTPAQTIYSTPAPAIQKLPELPPHEQPTAEQPTIPHPETTEPFMLPLWLYLMLVALPVIWTISRSYIHRWYAHWRLQRTRKQAVHAVQQAIARAVAAHNGYALFEAWQQFLSQMLPARWLHEDASGTTYVQAAGASAAELAQWRACWQALTEQAFGTKDISSLDALAQQANSCALLVYKIVARKGSV